jgi:D-3-phosphoglycerate dehydrogenase
MNKMSVLITESFPDVAVEVLASYELDVDVKLSLTQAELCSIIHSYDALIIRSQTKVSSEVLANARNLKIIGRAGVGVDNIDIETATKQGIIVMNVPSGNTISAAEHTFGLLIALSRNIPQAHLSVKQKEWRRKDFLGVEIMGKVLGIIGLGRIGTEVAKRALAFGMKVLAYDPYLSDEFYQTKIKTLGIERVDLENLLKNSDYISLHAPLSSSTYHLLSQREFSIMKQGVRIINCARGGIIDEEVLFENLKSGKVAGAALDVYEKEPPFESPLLNLPNCLTLPHLGASTQEAQQNVALQIAHQVGRGLKKGEIRNALNMPSVEPELLKHLKPYLKLGEKIGRLQAQLIKGHLQEIHLEYSGEISAYNISPLTTAVEKGILETILTTASVNYVNTPWLIKERGIKVTESKTSRSEDFANLLSVKVKTSEGEKRVAGTCFSDNELRVVYIDTFRVNAVPEGYLLILSQTDEPGIIGKVGTILGEAKINIGWLELSRKTVGSKALSVWNVDEFVPQSLIHQIEEIKEVAEVKLVKL